jgi:hypothetical protein
MKTWEYKVVNLSNIPGATPSLPEVDWEAELCSLGKEGWEIVRLLDRNDILYAFLTRPLE